MTEDGHGRFDPRITPPPTPRGLDIATTLRHFALVTYAVEPARLEAFVAAPFPLLTIPTDAGPRALVSVVLFENTAFRLAAWPSPRLRMAQINYRTYVMDPHTKGHAVWFLGTLLASWAFAVPRWLWKMPWRRGPIVMDCRWNAGTGRYERYEVESHSTWAPCRVKVAEEADTTLELPGFPDVETGLLQLTHALVGYYRRPDGRIGVNRVWHEKIDARPARLVEGDFGLLERMGLVNRREQAAPHSVLIAPEVDFLSEIPPRVL